MPLILVAILLAGACGGDESDDGSTGGGEGCEQILDRWVEIQQQLLIDLDDAEERGLSEEAVAALSAGTASGLFENSRDATRVGCEGVLVAGDAELCARVGDLEADGAASTAALAELESQCQS